MGGGVVAARHPLGDRVARVAGLRLHVSLLGQPGALHRQLDAQPLAQVAAVRLVLLRGGAQAVVHVQRGNLGAQAHGHVEQAHRVGAAGEHDQQRLPLGHQPAVAGGLQRRLTHRPQSSGGDPARNSCRGSSKPLSLTCPTFSNARSSDLETRSTTASVTSTSPPRARATTRDAVFTSRPK